MIDATSREALVDKTPIKARTVIANMTANCQQFGDRHQTPIRRVNEVGIYFDIQQQLATPTSLVQTMAIRDYLPRPCGVCSMVGHMTDMCPSLQERGSYEQANALGGFEGQQNFQGAPRPLNDPYSNTYNPGWRNHPNFSMLITQTRQPLPCHTISLMVSHNVGNPKFTNYLHLLKPHHLAKTPHLKS